MSEKTIKVYFDRNYQPAWDPAKEPKPDKLMRGAVTDLPEKEAKAMLKAKICRRAEDMTDEELGTA